MSGSILVLRALGLGDFLTALPALRAIARAFPDRRRVLAAPGDLAPLVHLTGVVDDVIPTEPLAPLDPAVGEPDLAVNLHGRGPQSHRLLLARRPSRLIAFAHREIPESAGGPPWRPGEHEVARWCRMLGAHGIPAEPAELDLVPPGFAPPTVPPDEVWGATIIHPGAASVARRWPVERWAAVARGEAARGRRIVLTGRANERPLTEALARQARLAPEQVYAGRTSLLELATLVAAAGRVLSSDTGIAHLATALRTPSVVLFGPTSPAEWGPPPDRSWHRVLWAGRTGDPHASRPDSGLLAITVKDVLEALADLDRGRAVTPVAA